MVRKGGRVPASLKTEHGAFGVQDIVDGRWRKRVSESHVKPRESPEMKLPAPVLQKSRLMTMDLKW